MSPDDAELVRRIARLDEEAAEELRSRYEQMFRTEAGQAVGKSRKQLDAEALELLVSEVAGIVIDNAKDYHPTQGPVVDWLRACAWVAAVFSLRRNDHWPDD